MSEIHRRKITGYVMPLGNGAVGKTSLALTLQHNQLPPDWKDFLSKVSKTVNLEFEYVADNLVTLNHRYEILHQYLIPPGQKEFGIAPESRSYDDVLQTYRPIIKRIDVVLLSYKVTNANSFNDIEYWVEKANEICNDNTNFILVGTHLDQKEKREVMPEDIETGPRYIFELIKGIRNTWNGHCTSMEVSSLSGENINKLRTLISQRLIMAAGYVVK